MSVARGDCIDVIILMCVQGNQLWDTTTQLWVCMCDLAANSHSRMEGASFNVVDHRCVHDQSSRWQPPHVGGMFPSWWQLHTLDVQLLERCAITRSGDMGRGLKVGGGSHSGGM